MNYSEAEVALGSFLDQADTGQLTPNGDLCKDLLKFLFMHPELGSKIAEVLAILAREPSFRDVAKEHGVLTKILPLLKSTDVDMRLQALRAVGNLCIDHDPSREIVLSSGGCALLIDQLSKCVDNTTEDGQSDRIKCITCGCILNVANSNGVVSKELLGLDVVSGLVQMISIPSQSENVVQMALQALAVLLDYAEIECLLTSPFSSELVHVLKQCVEGEKDILAEALEIIGILVENDEWKLYLVQNRCIDKLLEIKDLRLIKKVMDIIILIVAEDKCLDIIGTENEVVSKTMEWILSDDLSLEAKASAALIVANIARNDRNCLLLVEKGIVPLLIALIKMEEPQEVFGKLHHSALSALRNLSIPSQNKSLFLQLGVVDAGLYLLKRSTQAHVQLKAMGLLRLLAEKQAVTCSRIIMEEGLIDRVCEVCAAVGPIHIQSEGSRLLAALVKYCRSSELMSKIATERGMKWICKLLESEHVLMINDGLIALSLLAAVKNEHIFEVMVETANIPKKISSILALGNTSTEILSNALILIDKLRASDVIKHQLAASMELKSALQQLNPRDYSNEMKYLLEDISHELKIEYYIQ